ncbi:hypothetical protein BDZ97DRAFT_2078682 [Flammula alnicola]|nr:hypothetical protein BDZ97DRAFT_2078682 [Flammula alnicola]
MASGQNAYISGNPPDDDSSSSSGAEVPLVSGVRNFFQALGFLRTSNVVQTAPTFPVQKSSEIYYRHLSAKKRGSPLWIPEPNNYLPITYRKKGIAIRRHHNENRVPVDFSPLNPPLLPENDIQVYEELGEGTYLSSESITKEINDVGPSGINFIASAREGAILTMPEGAYTEDLANTARFRQYLELNIVSWYRYANGLLGRGREAKNGDLRLVIGVDKSRAWGMATFSNATHETNQPLTLRFKPKPDSSVGSSDGHG